MRRRDENRTQDKEKRGKKGTTLVISLNLILMGLSSPVLDLPYLSLHFYSYSAFNQALSK
jgi:hypothetical protein